MISHLSRAILSREISDMTISFAQNSAVPDNFSDNVLEPSVENIFDKVKDYEETCTNLPTVPAEIDDKIESRLLKLKSFNKSLNEYKEVDEVIEPIKESNIKIESTNKSPSKPAVQCEESESVFTTREDTEAFNEW